MSNDGAGVPGAAFRGVAGLAAPVRRRAPREFFPTMGKELAVTTAHHSVLSRQPGMVIGRTGLFGVTESEQGCPDARRTGSHARQTHPPIAAQEGGPGGVHRASTGWSRRSGRDRPAGPDAGLFNVVILFFSKPSNDPQPVAVAAIRDFSDNLPGAVKVLPRTGSSSPGSCATVFAMIATRPNPMNGWRDHPGRCRSA